MSSILDGLRSRTKRGAPSQRGVGSTARNRTINYARRMTVPAVESTPTNLLDNEVQRMLDEISETVTVLPAVSEPQQTVRPRSGSTSRATRSVPREPTQSREVMDRGPLSTSLSNATLTALSQETLSTKRGQAVLTEDKVLGWRTPHSETSNVEGNRLNMVTGIPLLAPSETRSSQ
jgi:hypothetical protein